jgi:chemotaxis protein methyltransferase CheR
VEILATDISQEVLDKAKAGMYTQFEVQRGLPIKYLMDNFQQVGDMWQISPEIRRMVQFKPFNLLDGFAALGTFDLVVCRNVLIYFDQETKVDVLKRLSAAMPDDGFLMLGAAETTIGLNQYFNAVEGRRGLHSRIGGAAGRAGGAVGLQQAQSA